MACGKVKKNEVILGFSTVWLSSPCLHILRAEHEGNHQALAGTKIKLRSLGLVKKWNGFTA